MPRCAMLCHALLCCFTQQVHPGWFKTGDRTDSDALQLAVDSCGGHCTVMLTQFYALSRVSASPAKEERCMLSRCTHMRP